jgi:DNA-binding NtrC family response regulator
MILHNVVTVGREADVQQLARQVAREVFAADTIAEASEISARVDPELILFDHRFTSDSVCEFIASNNNSDIPVVVIGDGAGGANTSEQFTEAGIQYLNGKREHSRINEIAKNINNKSQIDGDEKNADYFFADALAASAGMVGKSKATISTVKMIKLVADSRCNPILIVGATGTGKEVAAKAIHNQRHPDAKFVAVNCAALTANLLESELFGHVKGSFTSADREKTGLLELADNGSIFLDEISEMPLELQAKLLRVLQEKTFRKVGGTKEIQCKATIIASSNRNLKDEIQAKRFRADLYYRLDICPVALPALNSPQRRDDIPLLVEYFIKNSSICPESENKTRSITKLALEALQMHDWPGNVRELRNVVERAMLLETTDKIGLSSIVIDSENSDHFTDNTRADKIKGFSLEKAERELIARALQETNWQKTRAAQLLGISRATLYAKVKQHNIPSDSSENETPALSTPETIAVA